MKTIRRTLTWILACAAFVLVGCSKSEVDTRPVEKSFASAEPSLKSSADRAVAAIKAGDYATATAELQKLATQIKLTPEQQEAVRDTLAQIKDKFVEQAEKAKDEAGKALQDLGKSISK